MVPDFPIDFAEPVLVLFLFVYGTLLDRDWNQDLNRSTVWLLVFVLDRVPISWDLLRRSRRLDLFSIGSCHQPLRNSWSTLQKDLPKEANGLHLPLADRIRLNRPAVRIDWAGADGVVVTCADGSTYAADHVLVTCSLGVLKANPQLFRPSLPERKRRAIEFLGFGTVDKLYLRFERPWWRADWGGVSLLVGADDAVHYADWSMRIQGFCTVRNQVRGLKINHLI